MTILKTSETRPENKLDDERIKTITARENLRENQ